MAEKQNPFKSFWMGGFECADHLNFYGNRVDFLTITAHLSFIREDYELLKTFNIKTVREGIRWSKVEIKPYQYDFSIVGEMMAAGRDCGIQQLWDICHFGFPDDLTPLHPHFTPRFVALCKAFAQFYRSVEPDQPMVVTPINEVSFLSWLGGDEAGTAPYCRNNGWNVKYNLMRAYIAGVAALKEFDPRIIILTTEPLINVVPENDATPEQIIGAQNEHFNQYQSVDMLCGRICPELGGKPEYMDILGFNFYYNNQWVSGSHAFLGWNDFAIDPRWRNLSDLMTEAHQRYNLPVVLTETSHPLEDRPVWISHVGNETVKLLNQNIPFWGVCYYPIIDRPDWDHLHHWHHSGIWDTDASAVISDRILHEPSASALLEVQEKVTFAIGSSKNQTVFSTVKDRSLKTEDEDISLKREETIFDS